MELQEQLEAATAAKEAAVAAKEKISKELQDEKAAKKKAAAVLLGEVEMEE